jgi:Zn-dependent membrane protease YugP
MHPLLILVPVLGAAFGPRLWAKAELRRHDATDAALLPAAELARRLLDRHGLVLVRVEVTDLGDHYDPLAKAVRISRARFERASLSAATIAAHEVGHALQDATGHWAFRLHHLLARIARMTTGVGSALLLAVPVAAVAAPTAAASRALGLAAAGMLGTGLAAQLAALPAELDASFGRALPLLQACCLSPAQQHAARRVLLACSLTYVASAAVPALVLWPWLGSGRGVVRLGLIAAPGVAIPARNGRAGPRRPSRPLALPALAPGSSLRTAGGWTAAARVVAGADAASPGPPASSGRFSALRRLARPWVRGWLRLTGGY